ncbi:hypothetical protein EDD15DRAFT_2319477 [Pisolithus albus]|nr:hypothetical protein EDD15DRAFT_2319477 [Pisolithus albus]
MDDSKEVRQTNSDDDDDHHSNNMATALVAHPVVGVNKRYRPAPAKTFQCRGYGDCRMVFSRSEHLARHIRKHTGERPFTCHCSKQFSRLDNLRQHAQTVHADKQDQNERMMRELTSLHASMAAANKAGQPRGKRNQTVNQAPVAATAAAAASSSSSSSSATQHDPIKEEDFAPPLHYRPGTSTGYEGTDTLMYTASWSTDAGRTSSHPRPPNNYSFRDSSQSFRVPPASSSPFFNHHQQSFLPISSSTSTFSFTLPPSRDASRPPTAGATSTTTTESTSSSRSLPPLAAVVSASIPHPSPQHPPPSTLPPFSSTTTTTTTPTHHVLPLPSTAFARRPHTAGRPGTAPASFFVPSKPAYAGGPGLAHQQQSELPLPNYGRSAELAAAAAAAAAAGSYHHHQNQLLPLGTAASYETEPSSPSTTSYNDSPFSFHPPPAQLSDSTSTSSNLRKRPFSGLDSDDSPPPSRREHLSVLPGSSASSGGPGGPPTTEYDYGSESRPQSRRLTVMELCNDADVHVDGGVRPFLPSSGSGGNGNAISGGGASRPNTSTGLCSSASALALVDGSPSPSSTVIGPTSSPSPIPPSTTAAAAPSIRAGTQTTAAATVASSATSTTTTSGQEAFGFGGFSPGGGSGLGSNEAGGGGRVSASVRSEFSASPSPRGATGLFPAPTTSTAAAAAATPSPPPAWSPSPLSRRGDAEYQYGFKPQFREYGSAQQSYHHLQRFGGGQEQSQREREQQRERERETRGSPTVANAYPSAAVGMKA